jgi:hypothetical protein
MLTMWSKDGFGRLDTLDTVVSRELERAAAVVLALAAGLLLLAFLVELMRRRRRAPGVVDLLDRVVPRPARRVAVSLLAVVAANIPNAATAQDQPPLREWLSGVTTTTTTVPGTSTGTTATEDALAARQVGEPVPISSPAPLPTRWAPYVVVPGDCLWSIAARQLGTEADDVDIDRSWRAVYAANAAAIGDDPNLIHPGLELALPPLITP